MDEEERNSESEDEQPGFDDQDAEEQQGWEDEPEEIPGTFKLLVFFHTGQARQVALGYDSTVRELRETLQTDGVETWGSTVLVNGVPTPPDYERDTTLNPGDSVVFTGSVKGG